MPRRGPSRILLCCAVAFCIVIVFRYFPCHWGPTSTMVPRNPIKYMHDKQNKAYPYHKDMPIIFIGGVPRSGTTLMRAILDAHPDVRCGEETRVIPRILGLRAAWQRSKREALRLIEAGVTDEVLDSAVASFILEIMAKHGEPAPRLCNKDPFTLKSSMYLGSLFPNSKYILMVRDGRATVQSIINRKVTISGFDHRNYRHCLFKWNEAMETMYYQCIRLGIHRCLPVRYEELVLHPENLLRFILDFLGLEWDDAVLHHQDFVNKPGGISLSKTERSTDQVIKPLNLEALTRWVKDIPDSVKKDIDKIAPMLERLGYDPHAFPPNYGEADSLVVGNTNKIRENPHLWEEKFKKLWQASTKAMVNATAPTQEPGPGR